MVAENNHGQMYRSARSLPICTNSIYSRLKSLSGVTSHCPGQHLWSFPLYNHSKHPAASATHVMSKWLYLNTTQKKVRIPLFSIDAAMSVFFYYYYSVHSTLPRQQWMAQLCVRARQASNPNGDKISLFLSRLYNGSGWGECIDISQSRLSRHEKDIRNLIAALTGS